MVAEKKKAKKAKNLNIENIIKIRKEKRFPEGIFFRNIEHRKFSFSFPI